jgi:pimeloyl-ACP methyl ester carboxylesterase
MKARETMSSKTVLFIHGMFMTQRCWDGWIGYFQKRGYQCFAPSWPGRHLTIDKLRSLHPDLQLGKLTLDDVVSHFERILRGLPETPVIIGHSMGGLVAQILINRGLGAAGVAVDPAPPLGVFPTQWSFVRANWPVLNPFIPASTPHRMSLKQFQYAFVNGMPLEEQRRAYEEQVVPESRRVGRGALTRVARLDFSLPHAPLLILAGSIDHIIPPGLNRANYARYKRSPSLTDFHEFSGRNHYGIGQAGWEEMAAWVADWLGKNIV